VTGRLFPLLVFVLWLLTPLPAASDELPLWVSKIRTNYDGPIHIERVTYKGADAFVAKLNATMDAGDEFGLFTKGGVLLCRFGGFGGHVSSGACDIASIEYRKPN
jgi:hypothetical protein